MSTALYDNEIAVAVMDALTSQICVLDRDGVILAVNLAWTRFAEANSVQRVPNYIGVNYLRICEVANGPSSDEAPILFDGLRNVLNGDQEYFQMEYPCHSPTEMRWFLVRISPLRLRSTAGKEPRIGAVVSHMNITDRKLVELKYAKLASTDPLTGLANRRFFDEMATLELARYASFGQPFSILMIDLDNFKRINDAHGHAAGDLVLRHVASLGASVFKERDLFARWGGEEFVCLLPNTNGRSAMVAAERLRSEVQKASILLVDKVISVTISVGVSSVEAGDQSTEAILLRADQALYGAKNDGRNCVKQAAATRLIRSFAYNCSV